jgi:hypothetical protein
VRLDCFGVAALALARCAGERSYCATALKMGDPALPPIMSYIPALSWSGSFRLAALTREDRWREKPRREMQGRGGAMALLAAIEVATLRRSER